MNSDCNSTKTFEIQQLQPTIYKRKNWEWLNMGESVQLLSI